MVTKKPDIEIPVRLGITRKNGRYVLPLQRNIADQVHRITEWILVEEIVGIDIPLLYECLMSDDYLYPEQVVIAEQLARYDSTKGPYINVQITADELIAYLSILGQVPQGRITVADCLYCLLAEGVRRGFRSDNIREAIRGTLPVYMIIAARGKQPESGRDSEIILHEALCNSDSNHRDNTYLNHHVRVVRDEVIAQKLPVKQGQPGFTVTGKMLVKQVTDQPLPAGEHTYIGEDSLTLYAAIDGYLNWNDSELAVQDILKIEEDVDYRVGDIDYNGRILVKGDVRAGVTVTAEKDVEVMGCVEGGEIISRQGSIIIHRGINGLDKSYLSAGQNIIADYIQDASISAGGEVVVKRYVARSGLDVSRKIIVREREGLVRGGVLWSEQGIQVKVAGSSSCMNTIIGIRPKLTEAEQQTIEELQKMMADLLQQQNRLRRRLDFLSLLKKRQNQLSQTHQNEALRLSEDLIKASEKIVDFEEQICSLQSLNPTKLDFSKPLILVEKQIYPGVKFVIEDEELLIQQEIRGAEIMYTQGTIVLNTLDG